MALKHYAGLLLVLLLSVSAAPGCQSSDENTLPEIVTNIQSVQTESEEINTTAIAENSVSPIDEALEAAYEGDTLAIQMDAVYKLLELEPATGLQAAQDIFTGIDFEKDDFWDFGKYDSEEFVHDAGLMMNDMVDLLSSNEYETIAEETAEKLCSANDGLTADQRRVINDSLQDYPGLFLRMGAALIAGGWYDRENETLTDLDDVSNAVNNIELQIGSLILSGNDLAERLSAAHTISERITPQYIKRYGEKSGDLPLSFNANLLNDAADLLPDLTMEQGQDTFEQAKYLIVIKNSGNDDETEWQIDFNLQVLLPDENAPENISQATHIVAVENTWEYSMEYDNSKTRGYAAVSSIRIYEFASGRLLDDLGIVKTEPPTVISYTGEAPEVHYALPGRQKIFSIFADHAGIK